MEMVFAVRQCRLKWASLVDGFWRRAVCRSVSAFGWLRTKIAVFSSMQMLFLVGKPQWNPYKTILPLPIYSQFRRGPHPCRVIIGKGTHMLVALTQTKARG